MKILIVTQYFWPENFRVNDLASQLVRRGHSVTVLTGIPNYPEGQVFPEFRSAPSSFSTFEGAEIKRVPMLARGRGMVSLALNYLSFAVSGVLFGSWKLKGQDFDAIFVFQTSPITAAIPAIWLKTLKGATLHMWILDLWPESLPAVGAIRSKSLLAAVGRLVSWVYRSCDTLLIQSKAFTANVRQYGGSMERVHYFPNWVEPVFQDASREGEIAEELRPHLGEFNILYAGNIGEAQDFPAILEAAETLRDHASIRWILVGEGRVTDWIRAEITRRRLEGQVVLLGRFPLERMPQFFQGAQALLVSLRKDPIFSMTIPGKVQSYLAAGIPLLGMLDGEGARVVKESGGGWVAPSGMGKELARLALEMSRLSPGERTAMGEAGREYCLREFASESLLANLEALMARPRA